MEYKTDEQAETLTCISTLAPGQYLMKIEYTGMHNDKRMGFYRTKFEVSFELLIVFGVSFFKFFSPYKLTYGDRIS